MPVTGRALQYWGHAQAGGLTEAFGHMYVGARTLSCKSLLSVHVLVREAIESKIQLHRHWSLVNAQRVKFCNIVTIDLWHNISN